MKNLLYLSLLLLPLGLLAQTPKKEAPKPLTPEQQATLQAKKMRLHLDLNATQEEKIKASLTEHFTAVKQQRKVLREKQASRYDRQLAQLDAQLEMQEKMKAVLNQKQYDRWKQMHSKRQALAMQHKRKMHKAPKALKRPERPEKPKRSRQKRDY